MKKSKNGAKNTGGSRKAETKNSVFKQRVWAACRRIPRGRVSTYAEIARAIGKPRASRAVGNALNASPGMPSVPCHRVAKAGGEIGGFAKGTKTKLLGKEGLTVKKGKILGFEKKLFHLASSARLK